MSHDLNKTLEMITPITGSLRGIMVSVIIASGRGPGPGIELNPNNLSKNI